MTLMWRNSGLLGIQTGLENQDGGDNENGEGASNYRRQQAYLDAGEPIFVCSADTCSDLIEKA